MMTENNQLRRSKSIVFNIEEIGIKDSKGRNELRKEVEKGRKTVVQKNGRVKFEVKYNRKTGTSLTEVVKGRTELEVRRSVLRKQERGRNHLDQTEENPGELKKRRQKERNDVLDSVKKSSWMKGVDVKDGGKPGLTKEVREWKEQVVRVGTGYRVRKDEKNPQKRRFDVGYADLKPYIRKEGREVSVDSSNMGRTIIGKGKDARVKVMNAVSAMEKRRPVSEYTGSGILRKSRVGKLKLKPTKPSGKE